MSLSTKLQNRLSVSRQQRQNRQQAREQQQTRLFTVGVALGLSAGVTAFVSGAQHPASTLPPTPAITEVATSVESEPVTILTAEQHLAAALAVTAQEIQKAEADGRVIPGEVNQPSAEKMRVWKWSWAQVFEQCAIDQQNPEYSLTSGSKTRAVSSSSDACGLKDWHDGQMASYGVASANP
jgi:hypothetical protein